MIKHVLGNTLASVGVVGLSAVTSISIVMWYADGNGKSLIANLDNTVGEKTEYAKQYIRDTTQWVKDNSNGNSNDNGTAEPKQRIPSREDNMPNIATGDNPANLQDQKPDHNSKTLVVKREESLREKSTEKRQRDRKPDSVKKEDKKTKPKEIKQEKKKAPTKYADSANKDSTSKAVYSKSGCLKASGDDWLLTRSGKCKAYLASFSLENVAMELREMTRESGRNEDGNYYSEIKPTSALSQIDYLLVSQSCNSGDVCLLDGLEITSTQKLKADKWNAWLGRKTSNQVASAEPKIKLASYQEPAKKSKPAKPIWESGYSSKSESGVTCDHVKWKIKSQSKFPWTPEYTAKRAECGL